MPSQQGGNGVSRRLAFIAHGRARRLAKHSQTSCEPVGRFRESLECIRNAPGTIRSTSELASWSPGPSGIGSLLRIIELGLAATPVTVIAPCWTGGFCQTNKAEGT